MCGVCGGILTANCPLALPIFRDNFETFRNLRVHWKWKRHKLCFNISLIKKNHSKIINGVDLRKGNVWGVLSRENVLFLFFLLLLASYTTHIRTVFAQNTKSNRVIKTIPAHQIEHVNTQITCTKNTAHASIKILVRILLHDGQKRPQNTPKSPENVLGLMVVRLLTFFGRFSLSRSFAVANDDVGLLCQGEWFWLELITIFSVKLLEIL